jgi:hypothetical protein
LINASDTFAKKAESELSVDPSSELNKMKHCPILTEDVEQVSELKIFCF